MTPTEHFRQLEEKAGNNVYPVVTLRYGYAAFVAYVIRIKHQQQPDEWWVGELNKESEFVAVKRICQY